MIPTKPGQIVRFHTPLEGEDINQQYVLLEVNNASTPQKAKIKALNTGLPFPPVSLVALDTLEVAATSTDDLIGNVVFIIKSDESKILGRVISVDEKFVLTELTTTPSGVETNVRVTVIDKDGIKHEGMLFVSQS